jgi:excisionase family DNA binding protein
MTTKEVIELTGISRTKLCRMASDGECEAQRVGKNWRFPRSKVEDMTFIFKNNTVNNR